MRGSACEQSARHSQVVVVRRYGHQQVQQQLPAVLVDYPPGDNSSFTSAQVCTAFGQSNNMKINLINTNEYGLISVLQFYYVTWNPHYDCVSYIVHMCENVVGVWLVEEVKACFLIAIIPSMVHS